MSQPPQKRAKNDLTIRDDRPPQPTRARARSPISHSDASRRRGDELLAEMNSQVFEEFLARLYKNSPNYLYTLGFPDTSKLTDMRRIMELTPRQTDVEARLDEMKKLAKAYSDKLWEADQGTRALAIMDRITHLFASLSLAVASRALTVPDDVDTTPVTLDFSDDSDDDDDDEPERGGTVAIHGAPLKPKRSGPAASSAAASSSRSSVAGVKRQRIKTYAGSDDDDDDDDDE